MSFFFVFFAGQGSLMETTSLNLHCNKVRPCDCILSNGLWEEVLGTASNSWLVTYVWSSLLSFIYPFLLVGMWTLDHGNKNDILEMKTQWSKRLLGLLTSLQSKTTKTTSILGGEREIYSISFLLCMHVCSVEVPHSGFDLHFSDNEWCWASFHVFVIHLYVFIVGIQHSDRG